MNNNNNKKFKGIVSCFLATIRLLRILISYDIQTFVCDQFLPLEALTFCFVFFFFPLLCFGVALLYNKEFDWPLSPVPNSESESESESEVAQSCPTLCDLWTVAHQAPPSMGFSRQE